MLKDKNDEMKRPRKRDLLRARALVLKCGVRADLSGFSSLVEAVVLYAYQPVAFCKLYARLAESRGVKPKSVMREIAYALDQAFDLAERLSEILGIKIARIDIHSGLVIAYLATILNNSEITSDLNSPEKTSQITSENDKNDL